MNLDFQPNRVSKSLRKILPESVKNYPSSGHACPETNGQHIYVTLPAFVVPPFFYLIVQVCSDPAPEPKSEYKARRKGQ